jgi:hypothetical protein
VRVLLQDVSIGSDAMKERTMGDSPGMDRHPMVVKGQDSRGIESPLTLRVVAGASVSQIAEATSSTWQAIDQALAPILGSRGVAALYQRSVFLTSRTHAWLAGLHVGLEGRIDLPALRSLFSQQRSDDAAAAADAMFRSFHDLLTGLVGDSLTRRLLHAVEAANTANPPSPDSQGSSP